MQEDLAVTISDAPIDGVAAHYRDDVWVLLWLVFPEDRALAVEIQRIDGVGERRVQVHHVADYQGFALVATQHAGRECPGDLQLADVLGRDLIERRIAIIIIGDGWHHHIRRVLLHLEQIVAARGRRIRRRLGIGTSYHQCGR
jgi:hypothetical protein